MHADLLQRAGSMKGVLVAASQTGDGGRWALKNYPTLKVSVGMSFSNYARKVRDARLPLARRVSALHSCVVAYAWATNEPSYTQLLEHLSGLIGTNLRLANEEQLQVTLNLLVRVRSQIIEIRRKFGAKRIEQKQLGQRFPTKSEVIELSEAIEAIKKAANMLPIRG